MRLDGFRERLDFKTIDLFNGTFLCIRLCIRTEWVIEICTMVVYIVKGYYTDQRTFYNQGIHEKGSTE